MTPAQIEDLFIEWNVYDEKAKREMLKEFSETGTGDYSMENFFEFLRVKLEVAGYWKRVRME
jgi:hypothetical protein